MAETLKKIFPGNWVNHLNAHGLPNASFAANSRGTGAPQDRCHQAVLSFPGWMFVRKVGYAHIQEAASDFQITVPSPDLRPDDKPRADIKGLYIPEGAYAMRAGFRVVPRSSQPGSSSHGPVDAGDVVSGITASAVGLLALASLDLTGETPGAAAINGTTIKTATGAGASAGLVVPASLNVPIGSQAVIAAYGTPQLITTSGGLTLTLQARNAALDAAITLSSSIPGGAYVACELVYAVPEEVVDLEALHLGGALYSGQTP